MPPLLVEGLHENYHAERSQCRVVVSLLWSPSEKTPAALYVVVVGLAVNLLLHVPDLLIERYPLELSFYLTDPSRLYYFFSLDLFCLLSLLAFIPFERGGGWLYYTLTGAILFLLLYRTYDAVVLAMTHRSPIIYADHSHVIGALYLLLNASIPWPYLVGAVGAGGGLMLVAWRLPSLLYETHRHLCQLTLRRGALAAHLLVWPLVGVAAVTDRGIERQTYQDTCLSTVQCIAYNVQASLRLNRQTAQHQHRDVDSTYAEYGALEWTAPPSLYLVMLESYGSTLAENPTLRRPYNQFMARATDTLKASGWHSATARSEAPVFGGLSWLSMATVFLGTPIAFQPTFDLLRSELPRYPHLVWLLQRQGFQTATLQPPVRARPGLGLENPYAFDRTFYFADLYYRGPSYGWGIVPDQYSLAVAHERFVERAERPFFLFFETATPHGRWDRAPPPFVKSHQALNQPRSQIGAEEVTTGALGLEAETIRPDTLNQAERFFQHVRYDWRVLIEYLSTKAPANSLVVVLGDHQPFFADNDSFTTPLHVLSRDPALVRRFEPYGFTPGLLHSPAADPLHHAGLYSMLVRVLTAHDPPQSDTTAHALPPYRPQGVSRSALVDSQS